MRKLFLASLFLTGAVSYANMASPIRRGTSSASAFSSRNIDITQEKISITLDESFIYATFNIEYYIKTDSSGLQIPLLFYAVDYKDGFEVWLDGKPIEVSEIPDEYRNTPDGKFNVFSNTFSPPYNETGQEMVTVDWGESDWRMGSNTKEKYLLRELKYFETNLTKGEHIIVIKYKALAWQNKKGWINSYSFRYSLSPARYWRSFAKLEVKIDCSKRNERPEINLGNPSRGSSDSVAYWTFDSLPADFISITYQPKMNSRAKTLIGIGPFNLMILFGFFVFTLHIFLNWVYRSQKPNPRFSFVVITGSLLFPFIILLSLGEIYWLIDKTIGNDASGTHGYMSFMIIFLYPILMPIYWILQWLTDRFLRKKYQKK